MSPSIPTVRYLLTGLFLVLFLAAGMQPAAAQDEGRRTAPTADRTPRAAAYDASGEYDALRAQLRSRAASFESPASGLLLDLSPTLVDAAPYDGTPSDGPTNSGADDAAAPLNAQAWRLLAAQLHLSAIGDESPVPAPSVLRGRVEALTNSSVLPIGVIATPYHVSDGATTADAYRANRLFAASVAAVDAPVEAGRPVSFVVEPSLAFTGAGLQMSDVEVDLGDGLGFRTAAPGTLLQATYPQAGRRTATLRATAGAERLESRFTIDVQPAPLDGITAKSSCGDPSYQCPDLQTGPITSAYSYNAGSYDGGANPYLQNYEGSYAARYRYAVYYGDGNTTGKVRRPIIVTDGIDFGQDFGNGRTPAYIFNRLLNRGSVRFGDELLSQGYDIVIYDPGDALDFIQRNALGLVDLIDRVRSDLPSGEYIRAVVGPSLGGVLTRYALTYMEANGIPHGTPLLVSFDGAQQGGHIPLGIQQLADDILYHSIFGTVIQQAVGDFREQADGLLRSPAVRQLLVFNAFSGDYKSSPNSTFTRDPLKAQIYSELWSMGDYPAQPRRVAIVNGSPNGLRQLEGDSATDRVAPGERQLGVDARYTYGIGGFRWVSRAFAAPNASSSGKVFERIDYTCSINCAGWTEQDRSTWQIGGVRPYDSAPGGYRTTMKELRDQIPTASLTFDEALQLAADQNFGAIVQPILLMAATWSGFDFNVSAPHFRHSFIHTTSALDYNSTGKSRQSFVNSLFVDQNINHNVLNDASSVRKQRSPFHAFYLAGDGVDPNRENQEHVLLTAGIADFVRAELSNVRPPTNRTYTTSRTVGGDNIPSGATVTLYDGVQVTYTGPVTAGAGVRFRLGHNAQIIFEDRATLTGTGSNRIVVEPLASGDVWERVRIRGNGSLVKYATFRGGRTALYVSGDNVRVERSNFTDNRSGIYFVNALDAVSYDNYFRNNSSYGLYSSASHRLYSYSDYARDNGSAGFHIRSTNGLRMDSPNAYSNENDGIRIYYGDRAYLNDARATYNVDDGLYVYKGKVSPTRCTFSNNRGDGAYVYSGVLLYAKRCHFTNNSQDGISVAGTGIARTYKNGFNRIKNNGRYGVRVGSSTARAYVGWWAHTGENDVYDNGSYEIYNLGKNSDGSRFTVPAKVTYWDQVPGSGLFSGPVNTSGYLKCSSVDNTCYSTYEPPTYTPPDCTSGTYLCPIIEPVYYQRATTPDVDDPRAGDAIYQAWKASLPDPLPKYAWTTEVGEPDGLARQIDEVRQALLRNPSPSEAAGLLHELAGLTYLADPGSPAHATTDALLRAHRGPSGAKRAGTPHSTTAALLYAERLVRAERYDEALRWIAASRDVADPEARTTLYELEASAYESLGRYDDAVAALEAAASIAPHPSVAGDYTATDYDAVKEAIADLKGAPVHASPAATPAAAETQIPQATRLGAVYPVPTTGRATVDVHLNEAATVQISVYDVMGRRVMVRAERAMTPGIHSVDVDASTLASGVYFVRARIQAVSGGQQYFTQKLSVVR